MSIINDIELPVKENTMIKTVNFHGPGSRVLMTKYSQCFDTLNYFLVKAFSTSAVARTRVVTDWCNYYGRSVAHTYIGLCSTYKVLPISWLVDAFSHIDIWLSIVDANDLYRKVVVRDLEANLNKVTSEARRILALLAHIIPEYCYPEYPIVVSQLNGLNGEHTGKDDVRSLLVLPATVCATFRGLCSSGFDEGWIKTLGGVGAGSYTGADVLQNLELACWHLMSNNAKCGERLFGEPFLLQVSSFNNGDLVCGSDLESQSYDTVRNWVNTLEDKVIGGDSKGTSVNFNCSTVGDVSTWHACSFQANTDNLESTLSPSKFPTLAPTLSPSLAASPTPAPSPVPTAEPTENPTFKPTMSPTKSPTFRPTFVVRQLNGANGEYTGKDDVKGKSKKSKRSGANTSQKLVAVAQKQVSPGSVNSLVTSMVQAMSRMAATSKSSDGKKKSLVKFNYAALPDYARYALSLLNNRRFPMYHCPRDAYPSLPVSTWVDFVVVIGSSGYGFISVSLSPTNNLASVNCSGAGWTGTSTPTFGTSLTTASGVTRYALQNAPYASTQIASKTCMARFVNALLTWKYNGAAVDRNGTSVAVEDPYHNDMTGADYDSIMSYRNAHRFDHNNIREQDKMRLSLRPAIEGDYEYRPSVYGDESVPGYGIYPWAPTSYLANPSESDHYGAVIIQDSKPGNTYRARLTVTLEYIGDIAQGLSRPNAVPTPSAHTRGSSAASHAHTVSAMSGIIHPIESVAGTALSALGLQSAAKSLMSSSAAPAEQAAETAASDVWDIVPYAGDALALL
jgi:hypothetical protein